MVILGLNAFHADSAACLLVDGELVAAVEEERFRRIKHWSGFPTHSITYCLNHLNLSIKDVDIIAINQRKGGLVPRKILYALMYRPSLNFVVNSLVTRSRRSSLAELVLAEFPLSKFTGGFSFIEHHEAHLASAYYPSPHEESIVISVDGLGDLASFAVAIGRGTELKMVSRVYFPHSLGIFYSAMTQFLGFPNYGDEYKVMGLASYGNPSYVERLSHLLDIRDDGTFKLALSYFNHHRERIYSRSTDGAPQVGVLFNKRINSLLGEPRLVSSEVDERHTDLACSTQRLYETALLKKLRDVYRTYNISNLAIAGGCAMNSVANGKILSGTPFSRVYVQAAAGDAGGAIGAALATWHRLQQSRVRQRSRHSHAYWGPSYDIEQISELISQNCVTLDDLSISRSFMKEQVLLLKVVSSYIANGKIVGWFQGRAEWGPRALGNRSILCDPRNPDIKNILNLKIKRRESFRPFAPSVLQEHAQEWFECNDDVPFMEKVYPVKEAKRRLVPGVTHVDGTGRLQTVTSQSNPLFHGLITEFYRATAVPMLINTSFNENEPIVCSPQEALETFLRTGIDVLVLGSWVLRR